MLDYKKLSEKYMPSEIQLLLVGEAPPEGGTRFFYNVPERKFDYLFKAVYCAIDEEEERAYESHDCPEEMKAALLHKLQRKGVFITDLCPIPVDKLQNGLTPQSFTEDFIERIKMLPLAEDYKIIIFKGGSYIQPILDKGGYKSEILSMGRDTGSKGVFITGFREIYKTLKRRR